MSAVALQRVVVRMLFDPPLARRLFGGETLPELSEEEHAWLRAADPRAFRIDPFRRSRALAALIEEFPASSAIAVRRSGGVPRLDEFFGSSLFHAGMQAGASLSVLYAGHLQSLGERPAGLLELESALAQLRRAAPDDTDAEFSFSHQARLLVLPAGSVACYRLVLAALQKPGAELLEAVSDETVAVDAVVRPGEWEPERLLLQLNADGSARVETVSNELHAVMRCSVGGTDRSELYAIFANFEADREEADEVLAELVESGVLIHS